MLPDHSQTLLGHFWEKSFSDTKLRFVLNNSFCKNEPHMAALGNSPEAKYSYIDNLSFIFSPKPGVLRPKMGR